ncbi:MAG TPA: hypothetical protein PKL76_19045, partial [Phycisphaerae bacterium]|nr:hypothetical protein [Phycisphaerae bacterium]
MYSQMPGCTTCSRSTTIAADPASVSRPAVAVSKRRSGATSRFASGKPVGGTDCDRIVVLEPLVPAVKPRDLAWLGEADRYLAEKLLTEPFMYVDHPLFAEPDAEEILFGGPAVLASAQSTYFIETAASGPAETGSCLLNAADEKLLFQRFNYARMRVARLLESGRGRRVRRGDLQLMLAWLHRALMIRGRLTQANIPLVLSMAKRPQFAGLDASEVISA